MGRLTDNTLLTLAEYLEHHMGLFYPPRKWNDLEKQIMKSFADFKSDDFEAFMDWLLSSVPPTRDQVEILASHLTTGETYFFRDSGVFEILGERIIPELIRARKGTGRRIRIWSTACCTGEEPYSMAILLSRTLPDLKEWDISILATDINPCFLRKASEGVYGSWSFRGCPPPVIEKYFRKVGEGRFELSDDIRRMVTFAYHNLVDDPYPSLANQTDVVDVIFCRNVLMYFSEEMAKRVVLNLSRHLAEGGWLVTAPSESQHVPSDPFSAIHFSDAILYRKESGRQKEIEITRAVPDLKHAEVKAAPQVFYHALKKSTVPRHRTGKTSPLDAEGKGTQDARKISYETARVLYEQGCYDEAAEELLKFVSCNPNVVEALSMLTRVYANQGNLLEALKWCEKAIESDKLSPGLHYLRTTILQEQGAFEEAIRSLKRVLYLDPNFVLAHFAMGVLNCQLGQTRKASKDFSNVLLLLKNCPPDETLSESAGITAGRLAKIVQSIKQEKNLHD